MIDITISREEERDHIVFVVQIGPDNHVASTTRKFYADLNTSEDDALEEARIFANGAHSALNTAAALADQFISPPTIISEST